MLFINPNNKYIKLIIPLIVTAAIIIYTLMMTAISYSKFYSFSSDWPIDLAVYNQLFFNTSHGNPLYQTILYQGGHNHFSPIIIVLSVFYLFFTDIKTLSFLLSFLLSLGAIPVFLLAKDKLGHWAGLAFVMIYLLYPPLHILNLSDFRTDMIAIPFLIFAFYFFEKGSFRYFILFSLIVMTCKETLPLVIVMFGFYAAYKRKTLKWIVTPIATGLIWFFVAKELIIPALSGYRYIQFEVTLGSTMSGMIGEILKDPQTFISDYFTWSEWKKFVPIFLGPTILSFLSLPVLLLALPATVFIPVLPGLYKLPMYFYYKSVLIAFVFPATILATERLLKFILITDLDKKDIKHNNKGMLILLFFTIIAVGIFFIYPTPKSFKIDNSDKAAWELIEMIPEKASVSSDPSLIAALSGREKVHAFNRRAYHGEPILFFDVDYILIDIEKYHITKFKGDYVRNAKWVNNSSLFQVVGKKGEWTLFKQR